MRIEWLPDAAQDLHTQVAWIAQQDPWATISVGDAVEATVSRLADYPAMAQPGRVEGTRGLVVVGTPYVVVYRIEAAALVVLRILHGARRWPPL